VGEVREGERKFFSEDKEIQTVSGALIRRQQREGFTSTRSFAPLLLALLWQGRTFQLAHSGWIQSQFPENGYSLFINNK